MTDQVSFPTFSSFKPPSTALAPALEAPVFRPASKAVDGRARESADRRTDSQSYARHVQTTDNRTRPSSSRLPRESERHGYLDYQKGNRQAEGARNDRKLPHHPHTRRTGRHERGAAAEAIQRRNRSRSPRQDGDVHRPSKVSRLPDFVLTGGERTSDARPSNSAMPRRAEQKMLYDKGCRPAEPYILDAYPDPDNVKFLCGDTSRRPKYQCSGRPSRTSQIPYTCLIFCLSRRSGHRFAGRILFVKRDAEGRHETLHHR